LVYQLDGNLVIYVSGGVPTWSSGTEGHSVGSLEMQADGNLVLSDAMGPVRATRTEGNPGAMVQLQDDGNLVVYADPNGPRAGTPLRSVTNEFYPMRMLT
jgi:hypothetical protein